MPTMQEIREQVQLCHLCEDRVWFLPQNVVVRAPEERDGSGQAAIRLAYPLGERSIGWRDYPGLDVASAARRGLMQALEGVGDVEGAYAALRRFHDG